jgi:DNA-binding NtrC family response regulator
MSVTSHGQDAELAVLIVDDEPALASGLAAGLTAAQHHPIVATSAEDALRHLARRPDIGVVITDLRMPDRDGLDLAQEIIAGRREDEALEVILISGHASIETAATAVSARVSALLCKPFRLGAVVRAVDDAAARARGRRAASAAARRRDSRLAALEAERRQLLEWLDQARERLGGSFDRQDGMPERATARLALPAAPPL